MLKWILIAIAGAILVVLAFAATRPDTFHLERSAHLDATPDVIFPLLNDFRAWRAWSPYEKYDPGMQRTYGGPTSGVGATYAWSGNSQAGSGSMEILQADAPSKVVIRLSFTAPMAAVNTASFDVAPEGSGSRVTWSMDGPSPFISKLMWLFLSMDDLVGKDFESGLADLGKAAQRAAAQAP